MDMEDSIASKDRALSSLVKFSDIVDDAIPSN